MQTFFQSLKAGLSRTAPQDKISEGGPQASTRVRLGRLRPILARHWPNGLAGAGLILFTSLLAFPQPLLQRFLVDDVLLARRMDLLPLAIVLMGAIKVFSMGAGAVQGYFFTRFEQAVLRDLQSNLLDHALSLPKSFFDNKEVGYLLSRLSSDVNGLRWFFSSNIVYILSSVFRLVGGVFFLFYLEWRLGLVSLVVLPLLVALTRYFSGRMRALSHSGMERYASVTQRMEETLASIPLVKAFATEKRESGRVMSAVVDRQQVELEQVTVSSFANLAMGIVPSLAGGVVLVAGAYWIIRGEWTLGSLFAFQSYLGYVYGPAMILAGANLQFQNALASLERVSSVLEVLPEETPGAGLAVAKLRGGVRFERVSFDYGGQQAAVLKDVSFEAAPGEHIAIVGPSGGGKTSLVSLLLRFYRPTRGEIYFDGRPAGEYDLKALRQRIGYVSQATTLLAGTLRENLTYGAPDVTQAELEQAARVVGIHDFICGLPEGYDALVGERGVNLSEGQKQRLSIARALLKNPDILILDEPTSALDSATESHFLEALKPLAAGKTLFLIAHRLSTVQNVDRILVLDHQQLLAVGSHPELMATSSYYRDFVTSQQFLS
ncbi:MAG: ABC transporter ATP-binding protein [Anaerolineales bacterium]|jgi:ABC-type multidrug transport system fused ATPase/permease subunit|nr:ABC transporter ATP-binding protein [Anaerolineales bacterium]